jgi:putative DNA primase/helicase
VKGNGWSVNDPPGGWLPYRVDELPGDQPIVLVEGEKAADALWSINVPATTSAHGAHSSHKTDWQCLVGMTIYGWPDKHQPGYDYITSVFEEIAKHDN